MEVGTSPIAEAGGESVVTVTTGSGSTWPEARTVVLTLSGAAVEDADYGIGSKSLLLPAGSGLAVSSVTTTVTGIDDIIDDDGDTILIDAAIGATAVGTQQSIAITDDDAAPVVTVGVSPDSISENGGTATVTVTTADGASTFATDQAVALALTGTAMDGDDYDIASNSLTLPAGVGLEHAAVTTTVTGLNDAIDEADTETILIDATRGGSPVGTQQTLQVTDDDAAPVLEFRSSATQIAENGGVATLTVTTGTGSSFEQAQTITVSAQDGTALRGSDYALGPAALTLPAGEGLESSSVTTTVTGLDDGLYEGQADQTLTVSAAHGSDDVGAPIMLSIADDEAPSRPVLVLAPASIAEDSTFANGRSLISATVSPPAEVTFWLKTCLTGDVDRISYRMRFVSSPSFSGDERCGMVEFAAGATSSVVTSPSAAIFGNDNTIADGSATVTLTGEATGFDKVDTYRVQPNPLAGILAPAPLTLTVTDDDAAATTVTLTVNDSEVGEGEDATQITVTGTLSGDSPTGAVAVELSVESGPGASGAVAGEDFAEVVDFTLSIPNGQTSATATFTLTPLEDRVDEPAETLVVSGATTAADVGVAGTVSITLADNDAAPELALSVDPATVAENGGTSTVTVSTGTGSTYATAQTITLTLAGTATQGSDYTVGATTLVLPAGVGSATAEVDTTITAVNDTAADPGETVIVSASARQRVGGRRSLRLGPDRDHHR